MLKDKVVKVFDTDEFKVGTIVTYTYTEYDDEGEKVELPYSTNGLVRSCNETDLILTNSSGGKVTINISDITGGYAVIKGMAKDVAKTIGGR